MPDLSNHTLTAQVRVNFVPVSLIEVETVYPALAIEFSFLRGAPATYPTWGCAGTPAYPHEVEFISAKLLDGDGVQPTQEQINDWAEEYLASDEGYWAACEAAMRHSEPDPDYARDLRAEDNERF